MVLLVSGIVQLSDRTKGYPVTAYPTLVVAVCISIYWLTVIVKSVLISPKIGKLPNILPKEWQGMVSRLVMFPMLIVWIGYPYQLLFSHLHPTYFSLATLGAGLAFIALMLSFYSWHAMGTSWRIGIDTKDQTALVTNGPFQWIRHPIYTLSILLMLGTFLALQTQTAFYLMCVHFVLFYFEARREEAFLIKQHQSEYVHYMASTGRFFPKLF